MMHLNKYRKNGFILAAFDPFKSEILAELKRADYKDLEDKVYRMELTYHESAKNLDMKYYAGSSLDILYHQTYKKLMIIN